MTDAADLDPKCPDGELASPDYMPEDGNAEPVPMESEDEEPQHIE